MWKGTIDKLGRLVDCCSPEQGLVNVRKDAGGLLKQSPSSQRGICVNPLELSGHELEHVVVERAAVVAGEVASVGIKFSLSHPGAGVDLRSNNES